MSRWKPKSERAAERIHRKRLGRRIALVLHDQGMMQRHLAEVVDVAPGVVSQWISGRSGISTYRLARVAEATGVSANTLLPAPEGRSNPAEELGEGLLKMLGAKAQGLLALRPYVLELALLTGEPAAPAKPDPPDSK